MTANMLFTKREYSVALDELEQANALLPDHYTVLHLRGMCKAELNQYEDAIADLTGRAHYCNALYSRGMCHLNLGNHEKAFDDILRADILDSKVGATLCNAMNFIATIDPSNPQLQKTAQIRAALEKRKMSCLKVRLVLYVLPRRPVSSQTPCNEIQNQPYFACHGLFVSLCTLCGGFAPHVLTIMIGTNQHTCNCFCLTLLKLLLHATKTSA